MSITTRVPVTDDRSSGGKRSPASLSELYAIYGNPHDLHDIGRITARCVYIDGDADLSFEAADISDQPALDAWVELIEADTPSEIRSKINALPPLLTIEPGNVQWVVHHNGVERWLSDIPKREAQNPKVELVRVGSRDTPEVLDKLEAAIRKKVKEKAVENGTTPEPKKE